MMMMKQAGNNAVIVRIFLLIDQGMEKLTPSNHEDSLTDINYPAFPGRSVDVKQSVVFLRIFFAEKKENG